jgi:hypothetical protein
MIDSDFAVEYGRSWYRDKEGDRSVVDDVVVAWRKQAEHIHNFEAQSYDAIRRGDWDELNRLGAELSRLRRGELTTESNITNRLNPASQPSKTNRNDEHDYQPRQKYLRITRGSGLDGYRLRLAQEIQDRLSSVSLPSDPNVKSNPSVYKSGFQAGLRECLMLIEHPIFVEHKP